MLARHLTHGDGEAGEGLIGSGKPQIPHVLLLVDRELFTSLQRIEVEGYGAAIGDTN